MIVLKFICFLVLVKISSPKTSSREFLGYPVGFLSECPGSNKQARISSQNLKYLQFILHNETNFVKSFFTKKPYSYYNMKFLAKRLDFTKKTVLYVNGYLDSNYYITGMIPSLMGSAYKRLGYNVLAMEYNAFSTTVYPKAARLLRPVGKHAAEMLAELTKYGMDPKKIEIIGISHGGQAISFIAKNFRKITGMNISRVTGLDPSGPCFRDNGPEDRIDASDADFVEIVHTNIDGYGIAAPVGHVDYYINGGEFQPGDFVTLPCTMLCSHARSFTLWLASLFYPNSIIGIQCDSVQDARDRNCFDRKPRVTNLLGLNADKTKRGIFYVMCYNIFPYGMGARGLKKKNEVYRKEIAYYNQADILEY